MAIAALEAPTTDALAHETNIVERAAEIAREMLDMDMAYVADTRSGRQDYRCVVGDGASFGAVAGHGIPLEGTYCELLLEGRLDNVVDDARGHHLVSELEITDRGGIGAYIGVPIELSDGTIYGTFCCLSHERAPTLRDRDARFMQVLARLISDQIEAQERARELRRIEMAAGNVRALLAALAARDGYTEAHSTAVVDLALAVGRRLGLGTRALEDLEYAALLHDIGKIGVSDAILRKPGGLTAEEWAEMRRHPEIGEQIVASMPSLAHLAPIIRAEHERWDGGGYPDGLSGEEIPTTARIVLVCDAHHAMRSDRPYRAAIGFDAAIGELERNAASQFCPAVAAAAADVLRGR
jgi:response regulator RpfG family c-di-GMP phosphodiesterase